MGAIIDFCFFVLEVSLNAIIWIVIAWVIATWLILFNVINMRNRIGYSIVHFLERFSLTLLRPIQRIIPPLGGLDLSPFILLVIIQGTLTILLPALHGWLDGLVAGPAAI